MKTKWMIIPVITLTLGCSREMDTNVTYIDGEFTLYATSGESDTRTVLQQDGRVFWSPSDCITVFYGNVPGKFTSANTEPAASAKFTGSLGSFAIDGETEFRAIYPHSNDIVTPTDEGILSIGLPWEQTGVEDTFADDLFICVAKSKDVNLHFYNVCGGVKFSLARGDIKKVVFRGNNRETLAGRMAVEFDSDGIPQVTDMTGGKSSVTLFAPDGGTFKEGAFYYLVLVPQSLTKGYTMELWTDELVETVSSEASVTVRRSAWGVLKELGCNSAVDVEGAVDLGLPSGLLWATCNIGATKPEEYGEYYAWGETEQKNNCNWDNYKWCNGNNKSLTKYNTDPQYGNGFTDDIIVLLAEDDVAITKLGEKWRMPTLNEWNELRDYCSWEWTSINGVKGYQITAPNGHCIFLPATGWRIGSQFSNTGTVGYYWSSSLNTGKPYCAWYIIVSSNNYIVSSYVDRKDGVYIRPVFGESALISVDTISLDKTELELTVGWKSTLKATILPEDAWNKSLTWTSSDESVATVTPSGVVTGVSNGYALITVTTNDGGKIATCSVVVKERDFTPSIPIPDAIDLGLSVKWASFNLGASNPEDFGDYYASGETEPYYISLNPLTWKEGKESGYNWSTYKWCMGSDCTLTKYCTNSVYGYNGFWDGKTNLDLEDDAAFINLGGKWRMPREEEIEELIEKCTIKKVWINDVSGIMVTGANGNSIFLPATGYLSGINNPDDCGRKGYYWSSTIYSPHWANWAYGFIVEPYDYYFSGFEASRVNGYPIRPVYDNK